MGVRVLLTAGALAAALLAATLPADAMSGRSASPGITRAEAQRLAKAGVLTKNDLPKYDVERNTRGSADEAFDEAFYTCLGTKQPRYLVRNAGRMFTRGNLSIDSYADVVTTVRQAREDVKAVGSKKGAACYEQFFTDGAAEQGVEIESLAIKRVPLTVLSADQVIGLRITGEFTDEGDPVLIDLLLVIARVGQTEIAVTPGRFGGGTPSLKQARILTNKLAKRVAALT